jgi:hypothetical protein
MAPPSSFCRLPPWSFMAKMHLPRQKVSCGSSLSPEAPEDTLTTVNALVNLQDPIPKAPDNPATPIDASIALRGLQESVVAASDVGPSLEEPIVTSSAISLPPGGACLQELIVASSAVTPSPERVHPQEPIITSSAVIAPSPGQVCFVTDSFASSFPYVSCATLVLCLLSGFETHGVTFIRPCIRRLGHTRN